MIVSIIFLLALDGVDFGPLAKSLFFIVENITNDIVQNFKNCSYFWLG